MKHSCRKISLALCLAILAGTLGTVGCAKDTQNSPVKTAAPSITTSIDDPHESTAPETDPFAPKIENFGNADGSPSTFTMMVRKNRYRYLWDDGNSAERVNAAAYKRNTRLEEMYNIRIEIAETEDSADA